MMSLWKQIFHGEGHYAYSSEEAKRIYAKQLISLSDKMFWAMLAPIAGYFFSGFELNIFLVSIGIFTFALLGMLLRHGGLTIIDSINMGKIKIITPNDA